MNEGFKNQQFPETPDENNDEKWTVGDTVRIGFIVAIFALFWVIQDIYTMLIERQLEKNKTSYSKF